MRPIERLGDIGKAFLKIRIKENERNASRFHWIKNCDPNIIEVNKFIRLVFGLNQFPLISEGTSKQHFESFLSEYPKVINKVQNDMFVDNLVSDRTISIRLET